MQFYIIFGNWHIYMYTGIYTFNSYDKLILNSLHSQTVNLPNTCTQSGSNDKYLLHKICLDYKDVYISVLQLPHRHSSLMIHEQLSVLVWKASFLAFGDLLARDHWRDCNVEYIFSLSFVLISYVCQEFNLNKLNAYTLFHFFVF